MSTDITADDTTADDINVWAPGRVNLIGEHTDHTDGLALPMALDVGTQVRATGGGDRIILRSADKSDVVDVAADGSELPGEGWGRYVSAVAAELDAEGRPPVGLNGRVTSRLPQGAGLSSSASLEASVAVALLQAAKWSMPAIDLVRACRRAEHRAVGVPSGVLDQAASILCQAGSALYLDCADLSTDRVQLPTGMTVVVINSGVDRELEHSGYAQRTQELGRAVEVLDGRRPADVDPAELDMLLAGLDDVPARRLRHVVTENDRVRTAFDAFAGGDIDQIAKLFAASHDSLRDDFEVTVPETDALVDMLIDAGAVASRMTGGGFGGAVIGLVPDDGDAAAVADRAVAAYTTAFPDRTCQVLLSEPGPGAAELAPELVLTPTR